MDKLLENGIFAAGTVRLNRKQLPEELKNSKSLKLQRGNCEEMQRGELQLRYGMIKEPSLFSQPIAIL